MTTTSARAVHAATVVTAVGAVLLQLSLVVGGQATLLPENDPGLAVRVLRFFCYFTILSNVLVALAALPLLRDPGHDSPRWRVLRLDALVCITVTGVVHWFALRPLLDLHGASAVADGLLHVVVPVLAVAGWLLVGPRHRVTASDALRALVFPVGWLGVTLAHGALTGWYPYPFLDAGDLGYGRALLNSGAVAVLFAALAFGAARLDPLLARRAPAARGHR